MLVVGEAPSRWMAENGVTEPLVLARKDLAALAGVSMVEWKELFECVNVLDKWPGKQGKGDAFPPGEAALAAAKMCPKLKEHDKIVLLGRRVEAAFGFGEGPWFTWRGNVAVSPHPSLINRWWNEQANRIAAARFWGGLVDEVRSHQHIHRAVHGCDTPRLGVRGPSGHSTPLGVGEQVGRCIDATHLGG